VACKTKRMAEASPISRASVLAALNEVRDPKSGHGLSDAGLVTALVLRSDRAGFMIEIDAADAALYEPVREAAEAVLRKAAGVAQAQVVLTAAADPAQRPPDPGVVRVRRGERPEPPAQLRPPAGRQPAALKPANVRHVIAVASAKGGVGKSTVALNLAAAMAMLGRRVGLLDADVYGPSIPRMTGLSAEPEMTADRKLEPLVAWGMKVMSIGFLVDEGAPMIWRGPIASSALNQMLNDVAWASEREPLDVLVIDMPPGTGDVQLTLAQRVALSGVVIVSTPQPVALIDVRRGVAMFEKTHVPILGVVENMAFFPDPATGEPIAIFGRGGAKAVADELKTPFLGEIPIEVALREACDDGRPFVVSGVDSPASRALMATAEAVLDGLERADLKPAPRIVFED
jgi:ATP-binding protein involved in chromosome partitioning